MAQPDGIRALVTGGGGFIGGGVVRALCERGVNVTSLARSSYPQLAGLGVQQVQVDLRDAQAVAAACEGMDVVFHVAAKAGAWGDPSLYEAINVGGTQAIVDGCRAHGVQHLIYTSSPSVVFPGGDMEGADESVPYPQHYEADYPRTKAMAERLVLEADSETLATVSLRPHLVWGPGDNNLAPRILSRAKTGALRRIAAGPEDPGKLVDVTYIDDAVDAHLCAWDRLREGGEAAAKAKGRAYFISSGSPVPTWTMIDRILEAGGQPKLDKTVSPNAARFVAGIIEGTHRLFNKQGEPKMTKWVVNELSTAHWFDISAAKDRLGYEPKSDFEAGMKALAESLQP